MKSALPLTIYLILAICLTFYTPFRTAQARGSGAVSAMVICADGVTKTVLVGADGGLVEPEEHCPDCLACCDVIGAQTRAIEVGLTPFAVAAVRSVLPNAQVHAAKKRHILAVPRGPPGEGLAHDIPTPAIHSDLAQSILGARLHDKAAAA